MNSQIEMSEAILVAYIDGTLSPAQMAQVEHWYDASEENRKLFEQLYFILQLHDRTQSVKGISAEQSLAALKEKIAARNGKSGSKKVVSFGQSDHIPVKGSQPLIFQHIVVHKTPLATAVMETPVVALSGEINPLRMSELIPHEV